MRKTFRRKQKYENAEPPRKFWQRTRIIFPEISFKKKVQLQAKAEEKEKCPHYFII